MQSHSHINHLHLYLPQFYLEPIYLLYIYLTMVIHTNVCILNIFITYHNILFKDKRILKRIETFKLKCIFTINYISRVRNVLYFNICSILFVS